MLVGDRWEPEAADFIGVPRKTDKPLEKVELGVRLPQEGYGTGAAG